MAVKSYLGDTVSLSGQELGSS